MESITKAAIILTPFAREVDARQAISAVRSLNISHCEIWAFDQPSEDCSRLPVDAVLSLSSGVPLLADLYIPTLDKLSRDHSPDIYLFTGGHFSTDLAASFGCHSGGSCALSVTGLKRISGGISASRRVYDLQLDADIEFHTAPYIFSLAQDSFSPAGDFGSPSLAEFPFAAPKDSSWFSGYEETISSETSLDEHELILIGGRGLGCFDAAKNLDSLARCLDAGIGGTRPAVWNGWFSSNNLIGLSGQVVSPKVSIIFGASGAAPFTKGIEGSQVLAAVNQDPQSPIFRQCDFGIVDDCNKIIKELTALAQGASTSPSECQRQSENSKDEASQKENIQAVP